MIDMQFYEIIESISFHDLRPDGSFETWVDERRNDVMSSSVVSVIDDRPEIFSEIHVECLSDIEVVFRMFGILLVKWL